MIERRANEDFEWAVFKGFLRSVLSLITRRNNSLLSFDEVRARLPLKGQHSLGLRQVPIANIVGSMGRYNDFDRAFLPVQTRTKDRWVNISKAAYNDVSLPAIELYKIGEIYFVRDGNHRVSVARGRGQEFIDAFVTEIVVPVHLTADTRVDDLQLKQEYALFVEQTGLPGLRPGANLETALSGQYARLLEHISVHRWFLGEKRGQPVPFTEALLSWYDTLYLPLVQSLREHNLIADFNGVTETDLYVWVMEYQGYLREVYRDEGEEEAAKDLVARQFVQSHPLPAVKKLIQVLKRAAWLDEMMMEQEWAAFDEATRLSELRPSAQVKNSIPGRYGKLLEHIEVHRWYLGEQRKAEVPYDEAVASWYDSVYLPLVNAVREQNILAAFPGRTETDLYLWIIDHQWYLQQVYQDDISFERAAEQFAENYAEAGPHRKKKLRRG